MKHSLRGKIKWNYLLIAFLLPFLGMLTVMLLSQYEPFGHYSMLYSDMYHQYYPFFVAFRDALRGGHSLLYTWSVGMGMDYLGLISYYLASPLNLFSVLVPESWTLEFFSLLMPVKLGLASLFFAVFLKNMFHRNDLSIALFGGFYGLCAWALGYQWNVMWLDTFALLPLVALGTVKLIQEKKFVLYTLTLFLSVYANYYIGFFTCIFVFLLFFSVEICRWRGWKVFFRDLCRIALFSILAIGMTAILELPALAALGDTQSSVNKFPTGFRLNIASDHTFLGLLDAMRQVAGNMGGAIEPTFKEGLPNLYCGVGSILLAILFLMSEDVKLRDKLCCVFLLLFFNVSFIIRQLDYIWHGFHFTNMIPYRFSFLYSFVLLYMAYRAWIGRRKFDPLQIVAAVLFTASILACSNELLTMQDVDLGFGSLRLPVYIIYNVTFLLLYAGILLYGAIRRRLPRDAEERELVRAARQQKQRRRRAGILAFCLMGTELAATLICFGVYFPGTNVSNYPRGTEETASMIRYMKERERYNPFYRAETTHSQTLNDGALNSYHGISAFTSSANVKVTEFMKALGYGAKNTYNRYCFEESSPVSNLFLGLKYMLDRAGRDRSSEMFTEIHHFGQVHLLENNYYLPLGFLAEPELADLEFGMPGEEFVFQNRLFSAATGLEGDVWHQVEDLTISAVNTTILSSNTNGYCSYGESEGGAEVLYTYRPDREGFFCIQLDFPKRNDFHVLVNGQELYRETISLPQMLAVGDVHLGDVVEIRIEMDQNERSTLTVTGAVLDNELFRQGYELLSASVLGLTEFDDTFLEGMVDCNRDGLLYTSIPQNGNWQVTVDGEPVESTLVGDVMAAVPLTEGLHTVSFRYVNPAFRLGWKVTALCALAFIGLIFLDRKKKFTL